MSAVRIHSVHVHANLEASRGFDANPFSGLELFPGVVLRGWLSSLAAGWSRTRACLALPPARDQAAARRNRDMNAALLADPWRGRGLEEL
jgi:hypothetical protein